MSPTDAQKYDPCKDKTFEIKEQGGYYVAFTPGKTGCKSRLAKAESDLKNANTALELEKTSGTPDANKIAQLEASIKAKSGALDAAKAECAGKENEPDTPEQTMPEIGDGDPCFTKKKIDYIKNKIPQVNTQIATIIIQRALDNTGLTRTNEQIFTDLTGAIWNILERAGYSTGDMASALDNPVLMRDMLVKSGVSLQAATTLSGLYAKYAQTVMTERLETRKQVLDSIIRSLNLKDCMQDLKVLEDALAAKETEAGVVPDATGIFAITGGVTAEEAASMSSEALRSKVESKRAECAGLSTLSQDQQKTLAESRIERADIDSQFANNPTRLQTNRENLVRTLLLDSGKSQSEVDALMKEPLKAYQAVTTVMTKLGIGPRQATQVHEWFATASTNTALQKGEDILTSVNMGDLLNKIRSLDKKRGSNVYFNGKDLVAAYGDGTLIELSPNEKLMLRFAVGQYLFDGASLTIPTDLKLPYERARNTLELLKRSLVAYNNFRFDESLTQISPKNLDELTSLAPGLIPLIRETINTIGPDAYKKINSRVIVSQSRSLGLNDETSAERATAATDAERYASLARSTQGL